MSSIEKVPLEGIIPHRGPMVMIDALLEASGERGVAVKTFRRGEYGVRGDGVCETALVECVAQTAAALLAYGKPASPGAGQGFLAGLSSFAIARRPRIDERLLIEARLGRGFGEWLMVGGKVFAGEVGGECIAGGELKIYLKNTKAQGKTPWKI